MCQFPLFWTACVFLDWLPKSIITLASPTLNSQRMESGFPPRGIQVPV